MRDGSSSVTERLAAELLLGIAAKHPPTIWRTLRELDEAVRREDEERRYAADDLSRWRAEYGRQRDRFAAAAMTRVFLVKGTGVTSSERLLGVEFLEELSHGFESETLRVDPLADGEAAE
jgi:hypothetical protein